MGMFYITHQCTQRVRFYLAPLAAPTNLQAVDYTSPYSALLTWTHIPDNMWEGDKLGYLVYFERLSIGLVEEAPPLPRGSQEVGYVTSYELGGLEIYATYRIKIAARNAFGTGDYTSFVHVGELLLEISGDYTYFDFL